MGGTPVNNPPAPVLESADVVVRSEEECEALKDKYNIESGTHGTNPTGGKRQSHHIMQNAAMSNSVGNRIISTYSGYAVMLDGGSKWPGTEHDIANKHQAARSRKDTKNTNPTFGDLKRAAKADLAAAFQHGNPSRGMSNKEAEILADCLVLEAEKEQEKYRKKEGLKPAKLKDDNRTRPPRGCFAAGTLVWLDETARVKVESLKEGCEIETGMGSRVVARTEDCVSSLVELDLGDGRVAMAPFHRVRLAHGRYLCADALLRGHEVSTSNGPKRIVGVHRLEDPCPIYNFGLGDRAECRIGSCGLWVEVPESGPVISAHVEIGSIVSREDNACQR